MMSSQPDSPIAPLPGGMILSKIEKNAWGFFKIGEPVEFLQLHLWKSGLDSLPGFIKVYLGSEIQEIEFALGQTVVFWYFLFSK